MERLEERCSSVAKPQLMASRVALATLEGLRWVMVLEDSSRAGALFGTTPSLL